MDRLTIPLPTGVACASPDATLVERGEGYALIRSSRLAVLHGCAEGQFYRSGHNSWSPSAEALPADPMDCIVGRTGQGRLKPV